MTTSRALSKERHAAVIPLDLVSIGVEKDAGQRECTVNR